ncbi:MAG: hypothetical protein L6W00_18710 [Lentisphaeria bacterium]|nr:MAG: hypothetical protein L6W00_18710 [Lentisphaeria bacterium]
MAPHRNIKIIGNKISCTNNAAMAIASVTGCEIRNNVISDASLRPGQTWGTKLFGRKTPSRLPVPVMSSLKATVILLPTENPAVWSSVKVAKTLKSTTTKGFQELRENVIPLK